MICTHLMTGKQAGLSGERGLVKATPAVSDFVTKCYTKVKVLYALVLLPPWEASAVSDPGDSQS